MRFENFNSIYSISRPEADNWRFTNYEGDPDTASAGEEQRSRFTVTDPVFGGEFIRTYGGNSSSGYYLDTFWHLVSFRCNYNAADNANVVAESTTARLYIDTLFAGEESITTKRSVFVDSVNYYHLIGAQYFYDEEL